MKTAAFATLFLAATAAHAATAPTINNDGRRAAASFTADDYLNARSLMPRVSTLGANVTEADALAAGAAEGMTGAAPKVRWTRAPEQLVDAGALLRKALLDGFGGDNESLVTPQAIGSGAINFTLSRVFPDTTTKTYPHSAIGKLYFKISGAGYMCSASMIKPGVVVTAGHCVHSGNGASSGWYSDWQFIPAYNNGTAPFGTWTSWAAATTSSTWYGGGGTVPNDEDWALIVFNKDSSGKRIGDYTGYLGWQTNYLMGRHVTEVGYPGNLDSGARQERADSKVEKTSGNTGQWGSYMLGGSSGGPVTIDFGVTPAGAPSGLLTNRVASVVSYGYTDSAVMVQGGSQFNGNFSNLLSSICSSYAWAC